MAKIRAHLTHAPITEALIDVRVRPQRSAGLEAVRELSKNIEGYVQQGPIVHVQTKWTVTDDQVTQENSDLKEIGVRLHSANQKYVAQLRTDGFTLSRLEPYETWEDLVSEGRALWQIYRDGLEPERITRIATRYINQLKLPMKQGERFEDYLSTPPAVPGELPQGVLSFLQRVVLLSPQNAIKANVTQLLQEGPVPLDHVPVILDIDVYKSDLLPIDMDEAWGLLEELRAFKNQVFFAQLTEKTVELFT
jgi:uncharacterized protein (TIGR04255 family)